MQTDPVSSDHVASLRYVISWAITPVPLSESPERVGGFRFRRRSEEQQVQMQSLTVGLTVELWAGTVLIGISQRVSLHGINPRCSHRDPHRHTSDIRKSPDMWQHGRRVSLGISGRLSAGSGIGRATEQAYQRVNQHKKQTAGLARCCNGSVLQPLSFEADHSIWYATQNCGNDSDQNARWVKIKKRKRKMPKRCF